MKIATWNVNSITTKSDKKRKPGNNNLTQILKWTKDAKPDVLCLQEIMCTEEWFPTEFEDLGYKVEIHGKDGCNGVAILSQHETSDVRHRFFEEIDESFDESEARLISAKILGIDIVNVYVPNACKNKYPERFQYKIDLLKNLKVFFEQEYDKRSDVLLCGDFNIAHTKLDVYKKVTDSSFAFRPEERNALDELRDWGLVDLFRKFEKGSGYYTRWEWDKKNEKTGEIRRFFEKDGWRIDYIWVTESLADKCPNRCWIDIEPRKWKNSLELSTDVLTKKNISVSDHVPVIAEFHI